MHFQNHPHLVNSITICPYNQCHHVPKDELAEHLRNCKEHHTFKSIALKPLTGERLSSSLSGREEVGQNSYQRVVDHPGGSLESRRSYEEKQRQKNQDDLDGNRQLAERTCLHRRVIINDE